MRNKIANWELFNSLAKQFDAVVGDLFQNSDMPEQPIAGEDV
jgi:hypothetical protein